MAEFDNIQELLNDFRDNVIREAKSNLASGLNRKYPIQASGQLSKSLGSYVKESKNSIQISFEMEEYGIYQDRGVQGKNSGRSLDNYKYTNKMPPPKAFDKWVIRKGLAPRNKKGQFKGRSISSVGFRKSITFLIARSIYSKGIKPSLFFTKPFEKYFKKLPNELIEKYGLDIENLFNQITEENFKRLSK
jgi:hypothetical protein